MQQHGLGEIAVRIEQREALAGGEVLRDQVLQQRRFAGAGLNRRCRGGVVAPRPRA
jgi:hypothetical protein